MNQEIERKFLVTSLEWHRNDSGKHIAQGYLSVHPERAVRIRIQDGQATLCVKGQQSSRIRHEFEYEIPLPEAELMLNRLCLKPLIQKRRYVVDFREHLWEVDVFEGENQGLIVAEVELTTPDEPVSIPPWVGKEVTEDARYLNINLVLHPYREWRQQDRPAPSV